MLTKAIPLQVVELKAGANGERTFTAYASTFGNTDEGGDVMVKGAFDHTLATRDFRPLLWQHDMRSPIGVEQSLKVDGHGLLGKWKLLTTGPAEYAYEALKTGAVRAMSIGYIPEVIEFNVENEEVRYLKQVDLLENSVVSLPMNEDALVTGVKTAFCPTCGKATAEPAEHRAGNHSESKQALDLASLTFSDLADHLSLTADMFGQSTRKFLATLAEGHPLNDSKRQELEQLLGTFPGLDAVRADVQHLLQTPTAEPAPPSGAKSDSALSLRLELLRRRLAASGVEV